MSAAGKTNSIQFQHETIHEDMGGTVPVHQVTALSEGEPVGSMQWTARELQGVQVVPQHQRQGIATGLWNEGHRLAEEHGRIPSPKHSSDRTKAGDAWARSVGGRLPRRKS